MIEMNQKVEIIIEDDNYSEDGKPFTSVGFLASTYGAGYPCNNQEQINSAIENSKERITEAGDKFIITDKRKAASLARWF